MSIPRIALLLLLLHFPAVDSARCQQPASEEIPIERCDRLPVVKVRIAGRDWRFLVDTASTTTLHLRSFASGRDTQIRVTSWSGTAATSAREVSIAELSLGSRKLRGLKLPAIDLTPISHACGGPIDGILGVDLLEQLGATIDLKRSIARLGAGDNGEKDSVAAVRLREYKETLRDCTAAFNRGDVGVLAQCFDAEIVLFTPWGDYRGRDQVLRYVQEKYFRLQPGAQISIQPREVRLLGDAVWYDYDYRVEVPGHKIEGRGTSVCHYTEGRWRLFNMHNSFAAPQPAARP